MTTAVTGLFENRADALGAVSALQTAGVPVDEISIVTNKVDGQATQREVGDPTVANSMSETGTADGADLLTGLGAFTIPGFGPMLGEGWLVMTAIGAAAGASGGGIIGALVGAGVDKDDATAYAQGIRDGRTLVSVRVPDKDVLMIEAIMTKFKGSNRKQAPAERTVRAAAGRRILTTN